MTAWILISLLIGLCVWLDDRFWNRAAIVEDDDEDRYCPNCGAEYID